MPSVYYGELAFYHCYNLRHEPVGELVRVAGARWPIEECFQTGKGNVSDSTTTRFGSTTPGTGTSPLP